MGNRGAQTQNNGPIFTKQQPLWLYQNSEKLLLVHLLVFEIVSFENVNFCSGVHLIKATTVELCVFSNNYLTVV